MLHATMAGKAMIRNYGLFWRRESIYWGTGGKDMGGHLIGEGTNKSDMVDFRKQAGVYALYDSGFNLVYFGQVGGKGSSDLYHRLKQHDRKGHLADRWSLFSWFGIKDIGTKEVSVPQLRKSGKPFKVLGLTNLRELSKGDKPEISMGVFLNQLEAVVISVAEPNLNRQSGTWERVKQYRQFPDPRIKTLEKAVGVIAEGLKVARKK